MNRAFAIVLLCLLVTSCGYLSGRQPKINQGNAVSAEHIRELKIGQETSQVRNILGDPLTHPWKQNQVEVWEYPHYQEKLSKPAKQQRLTLHFKNNKLVKIIPHDEK